MRSSSSRIVRARASSAVGREPERLLAGVRVGDAVRDGAGGAGALRRTRSPSVERAPFGGALEAAVLVEEPRVEVEDPVADDVEAEVARLDHAGVDRPDRDLVGVVAAHGHGPARRGRGRGRRAAAAARGRRSRRRRGRRPRARPSRRPARGRRSTARSRRRRRPSRAASRPSGADEQRAHERAAGGRVQAGEAPAAGERLARRAAR